MSQRDMVPPPPRPPLPLHRSPDGPPICGAASGAVSVDNCSTLCGAAPSAVFMTMYCETSRSDSGG